MTMTFDLATLVAIRRRMEALGAPLLFHDTRTPQRQARRVARIMRWMGPTGRLVTRDYVQGVGSGKLEQARESRLRFKRGGLAA